MKELKIHINDNEVAVQYGIGYWEFLPLSDSWLWVLGALAFPDEYLPVKIADNRTNRKKHQADMTNY